MVVFGLYNGICVLPVLLSWLGPSAYLNARSGVALTSQQPAVSTQVGVKFYNFTSNEPTTDIEPHVVPQMDKTLQEKLLPLESIETGDIELGEMTKAPEVEPPLTCEQLIQDCEEYLKSVENSNANHSSL